MTALGAKSHIPPRLNLLQRLQLLARVLVSLPRLIFGITRDLLFNQDSVSFRTIWMRNTARVADTLPLPQARALQRPSGRTIASLCKAHHLRHETVELDAGSAFPRATLHFIDCDPTARSASGNGSGNVLVYFHGGGYITPLSAGHFKFARAAAQRLDAKCALLEYTLAPDLKYPGQLAQAAAALRYVLQYHAAADITIAGDSAGGNLALAVLAHLREPHPRVRPVFEGGDHHQQQLRAALCISPRCANECSAASYTYNASKDIVSKASMKMFNSHWEPVKEEVWATPLAGTKDFWGSVPAKKVLLLAGTDEVYVDDIRQFGELLGSSSRVDTELVLCTEEIHVQAIRDIAVDNWDGVMLKVALNWLQNLGGN
ncbi:probable carboxylesterase 18 [Aspergillus udagawae]|uniref:Probable carboxylesterase 18 n=1 Tax=Aspergillus udagawae TaxID=91492 RepID=A0ABQ1B3C5_9EURO|nr:probable carboxylesterase 18 [Aspergillus udagawae]GFF91615.1 probable carboxylesterase 18 [Aspergillus udagawae]GFG14258.1 probable carboxylesterase 18 [Aspergillus udagawae]GFG25904.1 probable carboxylesterase 18 [Aspergillus udagawae]